MQARPRRRRLLRWLLIAPLLFALLTVLQVLSLRFIDPPMSAFMVGRHIEAIGAGDWSYRTHYAWRDLEAIAPALPVSLVAAEDQNFASHHGFDFKAIEKARAHNQRMLERAAKRGTPVKRLRGASTISQQTAKNMFLWRGRSWMRKGLEAWYTVLIETLWSKHRILEVYANVAEFGDGTYGAQAAAVRFFNRNADKLTPAQAARLAAVLPNPRRYDAGHPGPYVQKRSAAIQRQANHLGGSAWLRALD
ncbi:monofunctional biosynthetic peptidoglycan transglycosylase [Lysobacter sp. A6]|uniref:Biosynthetic peptidoglycan transglycosylase n=1 Tax=Noviluteimonas lactosilytica TaxID=2888523 RepID=A0ABS8JK73_9GAMM|nr:monofunctional biosynthetic peptidoglycan transglycosylase [Lysobacter lactosilyticus]MCC8364011.1 monofunctional biosynthetic peptidoglycan transglycosylase [Lysobacter lactosilyticus]